MRADRLLKIMLLLHTQGSLTSNELAAKLEVSVRTIFRDMEALSAAGIPVYAERGSQGGWKLMEGYRTDWANMNKSEIVSLLAAKPHRHVADLGWDSTFEAALLKLLASLTPTLRRDVEYTRERLHVDGAGWHPSGEDVPLLHLVQEAVWEGRQLHMDYVSESRSGYRTVHPLGLVVKGTLWYLVALPADSNASDPQNMKTVEPRTYRISRIRAAEMLSAPAVRPEGFQLASYWEQSVNRFRADLPTYPARARVHEEARARLEQTRYVRIQAWSEPSPDGWYEAELAFNTLESAVGIILGFGARLLILEPAELRQAVVAGAQAIMTMYD
ncbi:helix-turn-helix transcriptional regulator [Paenibacillus sp. OAS669]|uniref:helix-turn-helix transcriptional regulator n=1 Tax=Paenibacillus sp. OAS669 TaxID=2663821 RepID=UPI00178BE553|nr:WYL domain-containing protein [Paenibacillus sp. OAS669]MBE1442401.1 putative DNA-binding transcriptional regulator YafY [Paenibacillus sp. OAS669]